MESSQPFTLVSLAIHHGDLSWKSDWERDTCWVHFPRPPSGSGLPGFQILASTLLDSKLASVASIYLGNFDFQFFGFQLFIELCSFLAPDTFWSLSQFWPKESKRQISPSLSPCRGSEISVSEERRWNAELQCSETSALPFMYEVLHIHRWWCKQYCKVCPPTTSCPYSYISISVHC